jgi:hypothetical protein
MTRKTELLNTTAIVAALSVICFAVSCGRRDAVEPAPGPVSESAVAPALNEAAVAEPEPDLDESETPRRPRGMAINRLVYTGCYSVEGAAGLTAAIEDVVLRQAITRKVGEDAFGFTVSEIDRNYLVLERDGEQYRLVMGANRHSAPAVPGIDSTNYPPTVVQSSDTLSRPLPALPPPESQSINPLRREDIPAEAQERLKQRLQEKQQAR